LLNNFLIILITRSKQPAFGCPGQLNIHLTP